MNHGDNLRKLQVVKNIQSEKLKESNGFSVSQK